MSRVTLARHRVTRISGEIRVDIAHAVQAYARQQRAGHAREPQWRWWEDRLKERVRELVREARLSGQGLDVTLAEALEASS